MVNDHYYAPFLGGLLSVQLFCMWSWYQSNNWEPLFIRLLFWPWPFVRVVLEKTCLGDLLHLCRMLGLIFAIISIRRVPLTWSCIILLLVTSLFLSYLSVCGPFLFIALYMQRMTLITNLFFQGSELWKFMLEIVVIR